MPTPSTYRFVAVENIATSQPPHFASARSAMNAPIEDAINGEFTTLIDDYNLDTCGSS